MAEPDRQKKSHPQHHDTGAIEIQGAREHNLKNISLAIPRNKFVVVTGVSGSGKSTLAFDLIFAEGQRRFLDAMNTYARQFVEQMSRPEVDLITGIPPTVAIEQRNSRGGGKSTVATVTEVYHFIRLLFARLGTLYCPLCQAPVAPQTPDALARHLGGTLRKRGQLTLLAPVIRNRKGFHTEIAVQAAKRGFAHVRADGLMHPTTERLRLDRFKEHNIEIVVGEIRPGQRRDETRKLIFQALETGDGSLFALDTGNTLTVHSVKRACPQCDRSFDELDPKHFSYNSSKGWCPKCRGFGELFYLPDVDRGARADAIEESWFGWQEGSRETCPDCEGSRLNPLARSVRLEWKSKSGGAESLTIDELGAMPVTNVGALASRLTFDGPRAPVARDILPEVRERLAFLQEVGLGYLQLNRSVTTLSGGESQRIRLAAQLGSNLSGVLYVLDEPTIGLHPRDNEQLLKALNMLRARGNSLLVVEHDEATMRQADYIIDLGPGAGVRGGEVVAAGSLEDLKKNPNSVTGEALRTKRIFPSRGARRPVVFRKGKKSEPTPFLHIAKAALHNLKNLSVTIPLQRLVVITGISGSGKSTLIRHCLKPLLDSALARDRHETPPELGALSGDHASLKYALEVDQTPIGRTPRSTPATYVGLFDPIRQLFAQTPDARLRGYSAGRFSFNSASGRCHECEGAGVVKLEMNFLPPAYVRCESCQGARYNQETIDIEFKGKTIADVLKMSVAEALDFFAATPKVAAPLEALRDTGLDYIQLGQISPTLSGGEAQRMKLVTHLLSGLKPSWARRGPARNLFILEEPTIGLHAHDVWRLIDILHRLVDLGHSVLVIEHHLDVIAEADWVIDLGPEGGDHGGQILAEGTPENIASNKRSHTGRFLRTVVTP